MVAMLYFVLGVTIATPIALAAIFIRRAYQEAARRKQQRLWREEFQAAREDLRKYIPSDIGF